MKPARYFRTAIALDGAPLGGRLFRKEVVRVGRWIHPDTGQDVEFSREDLATIAAETNRLIASGVKVPMPDGTHATGGAGSASNNLGFWQAFALEGDQLFGVLEAADDKIAAELGTRMRDVSIYLEPEVVDSHGKKYSPAITHVCATQFPVIEGQSNFVKLSRAGGNAQIPLFRLANSEDSMTLNKHLVAIAATLSLSVEGIKDDTELSTKIEEAQKKLADEKDAAVAAGKTTAAALSKTSGDANALAARLKTLEDESRAADEAARDGEIRATAEACKGKPEAFAATRQAKVKALWAKDKDGARELMQLAREAAGVETPIVAGAKPAPKGDEQQQAKDKLDTFVALARASGAKVEKDASGTYAVRPDGGRVRLPTAAR